MSGRGAWQLDPEDAVLALDRLRDARVVLMPTHQNVDADGLASPLAVRHALAQVGVEAYPVITDGDLPSNLRFLPGIESVLVYGQDPLPDYDRICLIDCADRKRLGRFSKEDPTRLDGRVPIVNVDHHVTNDRFGVVNIVVPDASSSAEIVAALLKAWGTELTAEIAQCLLAGIFGDTLGLRTPSTTPSTMRTAADLVDAGAALVPIVDNLFRLKPRSTVCLWEHALGNVQYAGPLVWTELTREGFRGCGAEMSEAEGLVNFLAGTEGSRAAVILYQDNDARGWRVSLRSLGEDVDVSAIAAVFGGGGHPRAAGVHIEGGPADRDAFLARVAELATPAIPATVPAGDDVASV
ncbi:MAG: RecJ [uncultured Thermomicrobiales bacterium]|uniref:RecJ n=1 Tax=uncultured Thermomicrobiales bacterium TaxID=1645740 RepID=A0A6J4V7T5_9BACT|nr:MAG: RecJ [uncultured Thermomicrobiales bacterium]